MILHVDVVNKIATFQKRDGSIVCGNSDYQIKFSFDSEWKDLPQKTARFIWNGSFHDVSFTGDTCDVPVLYDTTTVEVGVYAGELKTTTSAFIGCHRSILCESVIPNEDSDRIYASEAKEAADRAEAAADKCVTIDKIVKKTPSNGLIDTYLIVLTNGVEHEFEVTNGAPGVGIYKIEQTSDGGMLIITLTNDETFNFVIPNGGSSGTTPDPDPDPDPDPGTDPEYKEMTVRLSINKSSYTEYAGSVKGVELTWSVSEKASIKLTLPDGTEVDLTNETSPYTDPNEYFITEKKTWKLTATREDGRQETKSKDVSVNFNTYRVYWGVGKPEDRTDKDFMKEVKEEYDEAFVIGLKTSQAGIEGSQTISAASKRIGKFAFGPMNNQYAYFATPQKLWENDGEPKLRMGEFAVPGGFQSKKDVTFTRGNEKITYYLYRSTNLLEDDESDNLYVT